MGDTNVPELLERLRNAINGRDLEGIVDCFAPDVRSEQPAHPSRSFVGNEQVRANWTQLFAGLPDLSAELVRWSQLDDEVWSEWE
ncbi:MAG: nuclear transport factor 2 family protein [Mycobacteriales bacterium]